VSRTHDTVADHIADESLAPEPLHVVRLAGRIGAVIRGINLSEKLAVPTVTAIRAALVRHKVIFFRGQTDLDDISHLEFAAQLGTPLAHPTLPVAAGSRYVVELNSQQIQPAVPWHTDMTFLPDYPEISILRGVAIPEFGGDTMWANTAAAYSDLPTPMKALVDGLRAIHTKSFEHLAAAKSMDGSPESVERRRLLSGSVYEAEHPVVTVHPESGERCLLLGHFVKNLVGFSVQDSQRLLAILQDHITRPENTVRWKWNVGDVALWDNRATQHKPISDYDAQHRHVRRVTLAGSVAVGIDGKPSRLLRPKDAEPIAKLESST
jgi:alpha-ketoglutarate-dependent sulfate ester dioxygenase